MLKVFCSICLGVSFSIAICAFVTFLVFFYNKRSNFGNGKLAKRSGITPFQLLVLGVFVAATVMYFPIYANAFVADETWVKFAKTLFLSAQNALQLFTINAGFDNVREAINVANGLSPTLVNLYTVYVSIYFVVAPMLTAAFILSFVKGLYENWRYIRHIWLHKIYVFSELNENSLTLAKDILTTYKNKDEDANINEDDGKKIRVKRVIVFANVTQKLEEEKADLVASAHGLGAICLQKDITDVYLKRPRKKLYRKLYLISKNENENTTKALQLMAHCKQHYNTDKTHIYVFANSDESGILIDSVIFNHTNAKTDGNEQTESAFNIKVRRVNEKRNLIWSALRQSEKDLNLELPDTEHARTVSEDAPVIFRRAREQGKEKFIDVLIVGLGQYGTELLKTVCWYCQMPDYRLRIHVFDGHKNCEEKIRNIAPELMDYELKTEEREKKNLQRYNYDINFCNEAIDVREASFADKIAKLSNVTLAFVTLGEDTINIDTAIKLRRIFGKNHADNGFEVPPILTVVYDSDKAENLNRGERLKNDSKDGDYNIRFIGDVKTSYSILNIQQPELENVGLACHMHWAAINRQHAKDKEPTFEELRTDWFEMEKAYNTYEYSRRSSMAQAMHLMTRKLLIEDRCPEADREALKEILKRNEHNRWNAYMRADGYTVSPKGEDGKRLQKDTIAKIHQHLVPFEELEPIDREKDAMPVYTELLADYEEKSKLFAVGKEKTEK